MNMISEGDPARNTYGSGGASEAPTQPVFPHGSASAGSVGVDLRVLGPAEAVIDGRLVDLGPPKQRALFALLVSRVGRPVAIDVLLEELWSGDPPPAAMASLRAYIANLRRVLEPDRPPRTPATVLRTHASGYLLDNRNVDVDVHRFSGHARAGWEAWRQGDSQSALSEFEAGLALWRGQAYADVADATRVVPEVARLEELRQAVVEGRCAALLALGAHEVAVAELEAHVQVHPLREHGSELLALGLYRAGRQAEALAVLRATRMRLAEELGIDPGGALQRLERDILIHAPALDWHPPTSPHTHATEVTGVPQTLTTDPAPVDGQETSIALIASSGDLSHVQSENASVRRVWNVPARSPVFTGRDELLTVLRTALDDEQSMALVQALHGMGGIGKTALAIEYAHRHGTEYDVVWWVPAEEPALVADRLAELAHALGVATATELVTVTVARLLGTLRNRDRWLLIFDNAEEPAALSRYLPGGGGHVVITSRNPGWQELAIPMEVNVFDRGESITLLRHRAPQLTDGQAGRIAHALGDLPLALAQAGAHLADTAIGVEDYLSLLAERTTELLAQGAPVTYPVSLTASVYIALDRLVVQSPAALVLLSLAAYLAPEPIPLALFSSSPAQLPEPLGSVAGDPFAFTALTRLLRQYGLARIESATLVLHRLLAAILRNQPHQHQDLAALTVRLLRAAIPADNPCRNPPVWSAWRQFLPHVLVATDTHRHLIGVEEDVAWLLERAAKYLQTRGDAAASRPLFERAWDLRRSLLGDDHPHTLESAGGLSFNLWALGQYEQARQFAEDTLTRCRRALGDDHPHTLELAGSLCLNLWELGRYEQARQLAEDTLTRCRRALGDGHPYTLTPAHSLVYALRELGQYEQSRQLGEATLTRYRRILGEDHPDTLIGAFSLAPTLRALGQYERARQLGEDALTRMRRVLGEDHPSTLRSAHSLIATLRAMGQYEQARHLGEDTLTRRCRILGENHPDSLRSADSLAVTLRELGQYEQARQLSADTLTRMRRVLGEDHPDTLRSAHSLAVTLREAEQYEQARQLGEDTLTQCHPLLDETYPHILRSTHNLAAALANLGENDYAHRGEE